MGHCFSPEKVSSQQVPASFPELWRLSKSARHLKDLGLGLSKGGIAGTVGEKWLQPGPGAVRVSFPD